MPERTFEYIRKMFEMMDVGLISFLYFCLGLLY